MYQLNLSKKRNFKKKFFYFLSLAALLGVIVLLFIYGSIWLKVFAGLALGVTLFSAIIGNLLLKMTDNFYKINAIFWEGITGFVLAPYLYLLGAAVPISVMVLVKVPSIYVKIVVFAIIILPPIFYVAYLVKLILKEYKMSLWQFIKTKAKRKDEAELEKEAKNRDRIEFLYNQAERLQEKVNAKLLEDSIQY